VYESSDASGVDGDHANHGLMNAGADYAFH
jgi:hypothetical protein